MAVKRALAAGPGRASRLNPARESLASRRTRARAIARALARAYPDAWCALSYRTPWELVVATILSAQCTDAMVNQVTPALFAELPTPKALAAAPAERVETLIKRTGFFRQKTKALQATARAVVEQHGGEVPRTMEELYALPGIGRKTANVVLGTAFGEPAIFVDTHVRRVSNRLGLTFEDDPDKIERDLQQLLPPREWTAFAHRLIHHGRRICVARKPRCSVCPLLRWCPQVGVTASA
ncbi:MAG TPA: endonuclease III [Candidatus Binatus sp.]|nr:endonuclease III [Candidatus Binatus sp.]